MKNRYDLLVFDWDGTLFDSIAWIVESIQRAAAICQCEVPSDESARSVIGLSLDGAMAALFPAVSRPTATRLVEEYRHNYLARTFGEEDLFPQVRQMLEVLQQYGYRLAVATGKTRRGLIEAMAATATQGFFSAVRSADETASKPHPEMLLQLMRELKVVPERTLMVGDSVHDLRMARNAGVDAIAVSCGANTRQQLCELEPLLCLEHTAALLPLLV